MIQVTRKDSNCVASIPELCIAEKGATPEEALSAALQAEEEVKKTIKNAGVPLPPAGDAINSFPKTTQLIKKSFPFFAKVAIGYVLVACLTTTFLAIIFPSARSRIEEYVISKHAAADVEKALSKLGISICTEKH